MRLIRVNSSLEKDALTSNHVTRLTQLNCNLTETVIGFWTLTLSLQARVHAGAVVALNDL